MKVSRVIVVATVAALVAACTTLPPPAEGNKTLLVMVVKLAKAGGYALSYEFGLKESPETLRVNPQNGVVLFSALPPGTYTIDKVATVPGPTIAGGQYLGDTRPRPFSPPLKFELFEGMITILPVTLVVDEEQKGSSSIVQRQRLVPTNRDEALAELAKYDNFDRWKVAP